MKPQVWHTLVVRLWRDGDGLKVRFLASPTGQPPSHQMLATTPEAAVAEFARWLCSTEPHDEGFDGTAGTPTGTTPLRRPETRDDDGPAAGANTGRS